MAKGKQGEREKFAFLPVAAGPATEQAAASAVQRFVATFVIASRRERVAAMLLHKQREKRSEAIQTVYKWIDPNRQMELEGNAGFPQQLEKRFGDMHGILVEEATFRHVTVERAAVLSAGGFGAIFMADAQPIAVLFHEVGPPTLCS